MSYNRCRIKQCVIIDQHSEERRREVKLMALVIKDGDKRSPCREEYQNVPASEQCCGEHSAHESSSRRLSGCKTG